VGVLVSVNMGGYLLSIEGNLDVSVPDLHLVVPVVSFNAGVRTILEMISGISVLLVEHNGLAKISETVAEIELLLLGFVSYFEVHPSSINASEKSCTATIVALELAVTEVKHSGSA
jgi:hypothetical protein